MTFKEFYLYLKTISFIRIYNLFLVRFSYFITNVLKRQIKWGKPLSISIEPTTTCNLKCPECPSGLRKFSRETGNLEIKTLNRILDQLGRTLFYITFYFQGEPFINKNFIEMVKIAKRRNIFIATSTNAHYINKKNVEEIIKSKIDRLIISLDGTTAETYKKYRRGGDFDKVINAIKLLVEKKKELKSISPILELQFLVLKHNEHQIDEVKQLQKELGLDKLSLKSAQVYEFEEGNDFIPENEKHSRYTKTEDSKYRIKSELPNKCYRMWSGNVITWDGNIVPCCFDKDAEHQMGNILNEDFENILNNKKYNKFRNQILKDRSKIDICRNCSEGLKN